MLLNDGVEVHGQLIRQFEKVLVIRTSRDRVALIPWEQVRRVSARADKEIYRGLLCGRFEILCPPRYQRQLPREADQVGK